MEGDQAVCLFGRLSLVFLLLSFAQDLPLLQVLSVVATPLGRTRSNPVQVMLVVVDRIAAMLSQMTHPRL